MRDRCIRVGPCRHSADLNLHRVRCGEPLVQHLRCGRFAESEHHAGDVLRGEPGVTQQLVCGRHSDRVEMAQTRSRVGEHWPSERLCKQHHSSRIATTVPGNDDTTPAVEQRGKIDERIVRCSGRTRQRNTASWRCSARRHRPGDTHQRLTERQIEMHRSWPYTGGRREAVRGQRAPRVRGSAVGHAWIMEPANGIAIELGLVDGLGGTHIAQFRRTIGSTDDHWNCRLMRLNYGRMKVRRSRAAGAQQNRGCALQPDAQRDERGDPFVVGNVHRELGARRERQRHRRRARARRNHGMTHTMLDPFVDQGCAKCGRRVLRRGVLRLFRRGCERHRIYRGMYARRDLV